eukprot:3255104-Pyramimonas_sp.AAC.1
MALCSLADAHGSSLFWTYVRCEDDSTYHCLLLPLVRGPQMGRKWRSGRIADNAGGGGQCEWVTL